MGVRRKGREYALQALYLSDVTRLEPTQALKHVLKGDPPPEKAIADFAHKLTAGAAAHLTDLDEIIIRYAQNWEMKRMAALDRNVLRLGTYELIYETDTPVSVIIDEAVEIAKTYSTGDSGKFVNGILDKIKNERKASSS